MLRLLPLLRSSRFPPSARYCRTRYCRYLSSKKLDWMQQAEADAIKATNDRAATSGSANDVMMSKLSHELDGERVSNAIKMEDKLKQIIAKCHSATSRDATGRKIFSALRKKALQTRQDLITQREASGMSKDAANTVEAAFPIPPAA